ncbi:MAG: CBS domain-containing protein [Candidatus Aenigmarchaeota archaeon]|nr:CBS domain-containing protein [Candidatus Aenigmarchaeota archaeon]
MIGTFFKKRLLVRDVMSTGIITVEPNDTLIEAGKRMSENRIDNLLVVENGVLKGIITSTDIIKKGLAEGKAPKTKVKEIMTAPVKFVSEEEQVLHVVDKMLMDNIKRFPVMDMKRKELVGIITVKDIMRAMPNFLLDKIEWLRIRPGSEKKSKKVKGICEVCGKFTKDLKFSNGMWVCAECE